MSEDPVRRDIDELQARLVLAEDLLDALNRTVYEQQGVIDRLQRDLLALARQERANVPHDGAFREAERPPHCATAPRSVP